MLRLLCGLLLGGGLAAPAFADPPASGTARGQLLLEGEFPQLPPPLAIRIPACGVPVIPDESLVVDPETRGIANVFVYLRKLPAGYTPPPIPETPLIVTIRNCCYQPHVFLIRAGQKVFIKSEDVCAHNPHFWPIKNQPTSVFMKPNDRVDQSSHFTLTELIPVKLTCDIHPWMLSYAMVLDHPLGATTDAQGRFEIKDLPPGEHAFYVWHERTGYIDRAYKVKVEAGKVTELPPLKVPGEKFGTN